jgi:hypothetical protein
MRRRNTPERIHCDSGHLLWDRAAVPILMLWGLAMLGLGGWLLGFGGAEQFTLTSHTTPARSGLTCWDGPHKPQAVHPAGVCWLGSLALEQKIGPIGDQYSNDWCLTQVHSEKLHTKLAKVWDRGVCDNRRVGVILVQLVGYVRYNSLNPAASWPFNIDHVSLDSAFRDEPVVNLVYEPNGKVTLDNKVNCLLDETGSQNIQARYGHCSPPKQNGSDHNTSFFVWHKRGGPFYSVHLINTGMAEHKATYFARGVDPPGDPEVSNTLPISEDELKWLQEWWPKTRLHDMPTI